MERLHILLVLLLGHRWIFGSVVNVTVRSGENITLYCDCKILTDEIIMWYRNCTHENQPPLVLEKEKDPFKPTSGRATLVNFLPRFHFVENQSASSYDLLIMNISDSDEGLYYCGTEQSQSVGGNKHKYIYGYSNATTRIRFNSSDQISTDHPTLQECSICWKLLFVLCPTFAVLSSLLVSLLVHRLCQKTDDQQRFETSGRTRRNQDEDVFYATMETRQAAHRSKKITDSSDICTYSAINTSGI
ncbi:uncharacterized protein LOC109202629 [Oreochromis niloticus]|uniref:uncharacterized protein LOC109202629 n=1 Tax=Oreochromis niloticus TaxID=8128 RepID=UPI0009047169|nr:uncharacterized protein LOC109202629 [Oreochromis niloticus]